MAEFLVQYTEYIGPDWGWVAYAIAALVHCLLIFVLVLIAAAGFTWAERKVSARLQDRLGPTRTGGRFGWLQSPADGLKLLCKEDLVPGEADSVFFRLAPYVCFCTSLVVYVVLPFENGWVAQNLDASAFFILAILGVEVFGVIMAGCCSGSKWSLYGGVRETAQVIAYEIPLGLCVVIPVMIAGTMNLNTIGTMQQGWFTSWLIFQNPFVFVTFFVYLVCATASCNRAPFDLAEAESELVAGFLTEYSGFRWSMFFMAEYSSMLAVSILGSILFLGAWNGPIPITSLLGLTYENHALLGYLGSLIGMANLLAKGVAGVVFMMWLRWTLPRLRIDQVMTTCLKYCIPIAAVMFLGTMFWTFVARGGIF